MTYGGRTLGEEFEPGLVSVIIPTYNRAGLLEEAMESVWAQSYRPIELIVADDGSTDDTRHTVERFSDKCTEDEAFRVRYFWQENRGCAAARNLGMVESRGEYIQFLDSDDYFPSERLSILVSTARSVPGFEIAVTGREAVDEHGHMIRRRRPVDITADDRIERCIMSALLVSSVLLARAFVRRIGLFREDILFGVDAEYGIRVALRCKPECCKVLDQPLVYYRVHGGTRMVAEKYGIDVIRFRNSVVQALLREAGFGSRYDDALARREMRWFASGGSFDVVYLRCALELARSARLRARICLKLMLAPILRGGWITRRRMRANKRAGGRSGRAR